MADFTAGINQENKGLTNWERSNLFSDFVPGLFDYQNMYKSMMSAPFQKQPGGGVGSMRASRDQTMSQFLPGESSLVANAADQKNVFADLLNQSGALNWLLMSMQDQIKAGQTRLNTANSGGLLGILGL